MLPEVSRISILRLLWAGPFCVQMGCPKRLRQICLSCARTLWCASGPATFTSLYAELARTN